MIEKKRCTKTLECKRFLLTVFCSCHYTQKSRWDILSRNSDMFFLFDSWKNNLLAVGVVAINPIDIEFSVFENPQPIQWISRMTFRLFRVINFVVFFASIFLLIWFVGFVLTSIVTNIMYKYTIKFYLLKRERKKYNILRSTLTSFNNRNFFLSL